MRQDIGERVWLGEGDLVCALGIGMETVWDAMMKGESGVGKYADGAIADGEIWAARLEAETWRQIEKTADERGWNALTRVEKLGAYVVANTLEKHALAGENPTVRLIVASTKGNVGLMRGGEVLGGTEWVKNRLEIGEMARAIGAATGFAENKVACISNACISGVSAIIAAKRMVENGVAERVVVLGVDELSHFVVAGFGSFKSLETGRCKPYDKSRAGLNLGEGAGAVLVTRHEAEGRFALLGGAISNDANHISGPSRTGLELNYAIRDALGERNISPDKVGAVSAHGTATRYNDEMESKALAHAGLGEKPLNSLKGYIGHTLGASGVIETLMLMRELDEGVMLGTQGFVESDTPEKVNVSAAHRAIDADIAVKTASGFGGCNAAIVIGKTFVGHRVGRKDLPLRKEKRVEWKDNRLVAWDAQGEVALDIAAEAGMTHGDFARKCYKALGMDYPKFYKTDALSQMLLILSEVIFRNMPHDPERTGIVGMSRAGSLETDGQHALNIADGDEHASPATFVYTLANVGMGEVCIRHKIKQENTMWGSPIDLEAYARAVMREGRVEQCVGVEIEKYGNTAWGEMWVVGDGSL